MLAHGQSGNRLRKREIRIEVGVMGAASITSPPTGVEREFHQVGKSLFSAGARRGTAGKSPKLLQRLPGRRPLTPGMH